MPSAAYWRLVAVMALASSVRAFISGCKNVSKYLDQVVISVDSGESCSVLNHAVILLQVAK